MDFMSAKGSDPSKFNNLMIVDFLNLCFRFKHSHKKNFAAEAVTTIQSLGKSYNARDIVIAGDWGSKWRKSIYPEYKANREALKEKQTKEEADEFIEFLNEAGRALEMLKNMYIVFKFEGVEADDIAAYIAGKYSRKYDHSWLISSDKDWDLLINENVSRFSYVTRKEITLNNWGSHYDYNPEDHISIKVLQGDSGDNIPGVSGIGIKRAINLIKEFGSAYEIYSCLPLSSKYKYIQNLNESKELILLNYELMDLETNCHIALGKENCKIIDEEFQEEWPETDERINNIGQNGNDGEHYK